MATSSAADVTGLNPLVDKKGRNLKCELLPPQIVFLCLGTLFCSATQSANIHILKYPFKCNLIYIFYHLKNNFNMRPWKRKPHNILYLSHVRVHVVAYALFYKVILSCFFYFKSLQIKTFQMMSLTHMDKNNGIFCFCIVINLQLN